MVRKISLCTASIVALTAQIGVAQASILDTPLFEILGLVIVAGDSAGTNPVVGDFVIAPGGGTDLISTDINTVVTGTLDPLPTSGSSGTALTVNGGPGVDINVDSSGDGVVDASDSISAFTIDAATDIQFSSGGFQSSFYVASNTAFGLDGTAVMGNNDLLLALTDILVNADITTSGTDAGFAFGGANAQSPSAGTADVFVPAVNNLGDYGGQVYAGTRKTAVSSGPLASQMVRFDLSYTIANGGDLSLDPGFTEVNVTYTVTIP